MELNMDVDMDDFGGDLSDDESPDMFDVAAEQYNHDADAAQVWGSPPLS